jgi:hypothetical protein
MKIKRVKIVKMKRKNKLFKMNKTLNIIVIKKIALILK